MARHGRGFPIRPLISDFIGITAVVTGDATTGIDEDDVSGGGKQIIITLDGDTWVAAGGTFNAARQDIINGITSAQSEGTGWNAEWRDKEAVSAVVRTSDVVCTITMTVAASSYDITAQEIITVIVPQNAMVISPVGIVASPNFTVDFVAGGSVTSYYYQYLLAGAA